MSSRGSCGLALAVAGILLAPAAGAFGSYSTDYWVQTISPLPDESLLGTTASSVHRLFTDGTTSRVAGSPDTRGGTGDGGPATNALLEFPVSTAIQPDGGILIGESSVDRIRRIAPDGTISTVAGRGLFGWGCPAAQTVRSSIYPLVALRDGGFLVGGNAPRTIDRVWPDGRLTRVAGSPGTAQGAVSGDGGPVTDAGFREISDISLTQDGGYLVADERRIRRVAPDGTITTVAGTGLWGDPDEAIGRPATEAGFQGRMWVAATSDGGFFVSDKDKDRIYRVGPDGILHAFLGGADHPLDGPSDLAVTPTGGLLFLVEGVRVPGRVETGYRPPSPTRLPPGDPNRSDLGTGCAWVDTAFGPWGASFGDYYSNRPRLVVQPDGKPVVANTQHPMDGYSGGDYKIVVRRYGTDGKLDPSFGNAGVTEKLVTSYLAGTVSMATAPGNKIVVASSQSTSQETSALVLRLNPDGRPDSTFGSSGVAKIATPNHLATPTSAVVDGSGRIWIGTAEGMVMRLTPAGKLDTSFGPRNDGTATAPSPFQSVAAIALDSQGRVVLATGNDYGTHVARLTASGLPDSSFAGGQTRQIPGAKYGVSLAVGPGDAVLLSGFSASDSSACACARLARVTAGGDMDESFGTHGQVALPGTVAPQGANPAAASGDVVARPDGGVLFAGGDGATGLVARLKGDGTLDPAFGRGGRILTPFLEDGMFVEIAPDPSGRIVVLGEDQFMGWPQMGLFRLDPSLPAPSNPPAEQTPAAPASPGTSTPQPTTVPSTNPPATRPVGIRLRSLLRRGRIVIAVGPAARGPLSARLVLITSKTKRQTIATRRRVARSGRRTVVVFRLSRAMRRALLHHPRWRLAVRITLRDATGGLQRRTVTVLSRRS